MLKLGDACMAGTAKTNNMAIVTRDVKDFDGLDVEIVNPWEYS
jgi:predicted nucleic acid-binding protein